VITNLFPAFPLVGPKIVTLLWGGFSVDNPTLNRFFALHYLLPFVLVGVIFLHVAALHITGSNNPLGIDVKSPQDTLPFHPYYTIKDSVGICVFLIVFAALVFFAPNYLGDPNNFIPANPLQTPADIVPEWYFLPYYAILRSVPNKLLGVCMMFGSLLVMFVLPWLDTSNVRSARFRPIYRQLIFVWVAAVVVLGVCGAHKPQGVWVILSRVCTLYYFLHCPVAPRPSRWRKHDAPVSLTAGWFVGRRCLRRRCSGHASLGAGRTDAQRKMDLRTSVRHFRSRCHPTRVPGLFQRLFQLPFDETAALP
jgi:ubiquinol-cytochrome c reductase cytochrome b subunit